MNLNNIDEIVIFINDQLEQGKTLRELERNVFKVNDRVMEKRIRRKGYKKVNGKFVLQDNTDITHKDKILSSNNTQLTEEEIKILKKIAKNYKKIEPVTELQGEVVTRSFRTYKNVLEDFAKYCKENNLSQKESIATALINFMKN